MSFEIPLTIEYGDAKVSVTANYHTFTKALIDTTLLPLIGPDPNFEPDPNDPNSTAPDIILDDGAMSEVHISSFESYQKYAQNRGSIDFAVRTKVYKVPMMVVYQIQRFPSQLSPEQQMYDYIRSIDQDFANAQDVP